MHRNIGPSARTWETNSCFNEFSPQKSRRGKLNDLIVHIINCEVLLIPIISHIFSVLVFDISEGHVVGNNSFYFQLSPSRTFGGLYIKNCHNE